MRPIPSFSWLISQRNAPTTLFFVALALHLMVLGTMLFHYGPFSLFLSDGTLNGNDTQNYVTIAKNLVEGHGYSRFPDAPFDPDSFRTPLIVFYFVPFVAVGGLSLVWFAILLLNIALSFAPVVLYRLARLYLPQTFAVIAGLVMAFEPLFLYRSQIAEPDALLVLLLLLGTYYLARSWKTLMTRDFYIATAIFGLAILAKPTAMYLAAIVLIFHAGFLAFWSGETWAVLCKRLCIGAVIVVAIVSPWLVRNRIVFGQWGISSIVANNFYEYYTSDIKLPDEKLPLAMQGVREPSRNLTYQDYFMGVAMERIRHQPMVYLRGQAVGILRNLFVTDISAIYYYGQTAILPFPYNPESKTNIHEFLLRNDIPGAVRALFTGNMLPKILWMLLLGLMYCFAFFGWVRSWKEDRLMFFTFTLFLCFYGYLLVGSGPFVDAKYRLPALPLIAVIALYGASRLVVHLKERRTLPRS